MLSAVLLAGSILASSVQAATGYIDLSVSGGVPDGSKSPSLAHSHLLSVCPLIFILLCFALPTEASGIIYGVPNGPAFTPDPAPAVPWDLFKGAGINYFRAGGAQIPAAGYSSGNITAYRERLKSTKENYDGVLANGVRKFVLLPVSNQHSGLCDV